MKETENQNQIPKWKSETPYVLEYDYNFRGKVEHAIIYIMNHQLEHEIAMAKNVGAWNINYYIRFDIME